MTHLTFDRISELADSPEPRADNREPHLSECAECRATLDRVRALVSAAHALPRDVAPPPEIWSALRTRVPVRPRRRPVLRFVAAAAAVIVMALGLTIVLGPRNRLKGGKLPPPPELVAVDMSYINTVEELRQSLDRARRAMSPATASAVDHSLGVVDTAIDETRKALFRDPSNQTLADILAANYQRKVELLQRATELSSSF